VVFEEASREALNGNSMELALVELGSNGLKLQLLPPMVTGDACANFQEANADLRLNLARIAALRFEHDILWDRLRYACQGIGYLESTAPGWMWVREILRLGAVAEEAAGRRPAALAEPATIMVHELIDLVVRAQSTLTGLIVAKLAVEYPLRWVAEETAWSAEIPVAGNWDLRIKLPPGEFLPNPLTLMIVDNDGRAAPWPANGGAGTVANVGPHPSGRIKVTLLNEAGERCRLQNPAAASVRLVPRQ